ncbi:RND transporter [bacterium]|nr:RND transporter [bacterium]
MKTRIFGFSSMGVGLLGVALLSLLGCSSSQPTAADSNEPSELTSDEHGHVHDEWWCAEHGVPEEVCALCDTSLIADFKAKGDWCEEHNRPASQCFVCSPELFDGFAARYNAKYGEDPPKPEDLKTDSGS